MKLTSFTDYSLRVLIFLAARPGERATAGEISTYFDISAHHLNKVIHFLGKCGWLNNSRGKGGGIELAVDPERIVVGEVIRLTEGPPLLAECFEPQGGDCVIGPACQLHGLLSEAADAFYAALDRYTLADLVRRGDGTAQVLFTRRST